MSEYQSRAEREKDYKETIEWSLFVPNDENAEQKMKDIQQAYEYLHKAGLVVCKTQFAAGLLQMVHTPIPLAVASAICDCSRQWFRNMENHGRILIIRSTQKKCYIAPEDLIKIMEGRI